MLGDGWLQAKGLIIGQQQAGIWIVYPPGAGITGDEDGLRVGKMARISLNH